MICENCLSEALRHEGRKTGREAEGMASDRDARLNGGVVDRGKE
jgi:hypothetical protein